VKISTIFIYLLKDKWPICLSELFVSVLYLVCLGKKVEEIETVFFLFLW